MYSQSENLQGIGEAFGKGVRNIALVLGLGAIAGGVIGYKVTKNKSGFTSIFATTAGATAGLMASTLVYKKISDVDTRSSTWNVG